VKEELKAKLIAYLKSIGYDCEDLRLVVDANSISFQGMATKE
jgi:hypothetical protein